MTTFSTRIGNILWVVGAILLASLSAGTQDVSEIIRRSAEANSRDWAAVPDFNNQERDRNKDGDKTYAVTMIDGSPYERLIAVNGRRLSAVQQKEEQKKYDKTVVERQQESPNKRSQRIARYQTGSVITYSLTN